jgi:hypothetical protein
MGLTHFLMDLTLFLMTLTSVGLLIAGKNEENAWLDLNLIVYANFY